MIPVLQDGDIGLLYQVIANWYNNYFCQLEIDLFGVTLKIWMILGWAMVGSVVLKIFHEWQYG